MYFNILTVVDAKRGYVIRGNPKRIACRFQHRPAGWGTMEKPADKETGKYREGQEIRPIGAARDLESPAYTGAHGRIQMGKAA